MERRLSAYWTRTRERLEEAFSELEEAFSELEEAFSEDLPPHDVAATFSGGVFVSALPNFGLALVCFALAARYLERVSNLALMAVLIAMNPPVKWVIYGAGFWIGSRLLGPIPGTNGWELSSAIGSAVLLRLLVGTAVVAAVLAVAGYLAALRVVHEVRRRDLELAAEIADEITE